MSDLLKVKVGGSDYLCKWDGIKTIYSTDFSSFDYINKIDHPLVGSQTSYNNTNKTYFAGSDGSLVADSNSNNTVATNGIEFSITKNTELVSTVKLNYYHTSNSLHFLWLNRFGFEFENYYGNQVNVMINNSLTYDLENGAAFIESDAGYNWIRIPDSNPSINNEFMVRFAIVGNSIDAITTFNGTQYVIVHNVSFSQKFFIDPRKGGTISCKNVRISQYQLGF